LPLVCYGRFSGLQTDETSDLNLVAELANSLAERTLEALEHGRLTTEEFRENPDVALILDAARLLQAAGAEFPPAIREARPKGGRANSNLRAFRARSKTTTARLQQRAESGPLRPRPAGLVRAFPRIAGRWQAPDPSVGLGRDG
jgi:hypothetical protein